MGLTKDQISRLGFQIVTNFDKSFAGMVYEIGDEFQWWMPKNSTEIYLYKREGQRFYNTQFLIKIGDANYGRIKEMLDRIHRAFLDNYQDKYNDNPKIRDISKKEIKNIIESQFQYLRFLIKSKDLYSLKLPMIGTFGVSFTNLKRLVSIGMIDPEVAQHHLDLYYSKNRQLTKFNKIILKQLQEEINKKREEKEENKYVDK